MHLIPARAGLPSVHRTDTFTGDVWGDPVTALGADPTVNTVVFAPGARTYWHSHGSGQLLVITHGAGFVVRRDGVGGPIRAGQSVWTPAGEVHWHGGGPDSLLTHTAYSFGTTEWLGEVTEEEYLSAVHRAAWE